MPTEPATAALSDVRRSVKLAVFSVDVAIASEKVALMALAAATALAPLEGEVDETVGGVESAVPPPGWPPAPADPPSSPPPDPPPHPEERIAIDRATSAQASLPATTADRAKWPP
jgi:hypothetical protein